MYSYIYSKYSIYTYILVKYYIRSLLVEFEHCVASVSLFSLFCEQGISIKKS